MGVRIKIFFINNFKVIVFPLSRSFDEGVGRDVSKFQDIDAANFITSSISSGVANLWVVSGANKQGTLGSDDIDIISSGNLSDGNGEIDLFKVQTFSKGTEDLSVNVTNIVSATLANQIPDYGFRISFSGTQETDNITRFVKRFGSRHSNNTRKRPRLEVRYNDAIQDHHEAFYFNMSGSVFLNNFQRGQLSNIVSGSTLSQVTGTNCLRYKIVTGAFEKVVSASQHSFGSSLFMSGVYSASFALNSFGSSSLGGNVNSTLEDHLRDSGSVTFTTYWESPDMNIGFHTGSLTMKSPTMSSYDTGAKRFVVNVSNIKGSYRLGQKVRLRCVAYDDNEKVKAVKTPLYRTSEILVKSFYQIRDAFSDDIVIPYDETYSATLMSTDSKGMYFDIFTDDLEVGRVYAIDVKVKSNNTTQVFKDAGGTFRIEP